MKWIRRTGIALLSLGILLVLAILALQTAPARRYVLGKVQSILADSGIRLDVTSFSYNLLSTSLELRNFRIASERPDLPPLLEADRLYVRVAMVPLFRGIVRIVDGNLDRPIIRYAVNGAGVSNLPVGKSAAEPAPSSQGGGLQNLTAHFQIGHFQIKDGALAVRDDAAQLEARLPLWQATIGDRAGTNTQIDFETQQAGESVVSGRLIPVDQLLIRGGLGLDGKTLTLDSARLDALGSTISAKGAIHDLAASEPALSANGEMHLALARLAALADVGKVASGDIDAQFSAKGPFDAIQAQFQVAGGDLPLSVGAFSAQRFSASGAYDVAAQEISLQSLDLGLGAGSLQAQGKLALGAGRSSVRARVSNVDLERIADALSLKFQIASRATGTVSASWPGMKFREADGNALMRFAKIREQAQEGSLPLAGDIEALIRKGQVTLFLGQRPSSANEQHPIPAKPEPARAPNNVRGDGRSMVDSASVVVAAYHPDDASYGGFRLVSAAAPERVVPPVLSWMRFLGLGGLFAQQAGAESVSPIPLDALEALATVLRGQVTVTPAGGLSGRLSAHVRDLGALLANLSALTGGSVPASVPLQGEADVVANISGDIEAPVVDVQTTAKSVQVGRLQNISAVVSAVYSPAQLMIRSAMIQQENQSVEVHGMIALTANGPMDLDARVDNLQVATVLDTAGGGNLPVSGTVSLQGNVKGTRQQPDATVSATAADLKAYGEMWGSLELDAEMVGQRIDVSRIELKKTAGDPKDAAKIEDAGGMTASGSYDLQSQEYAVDLKTSDLRVQQLAFGGHAVSGVLNVSAKGQGSLERPMLTADLGVTDLLVDSQNPANQLSGKLSANVEVEGDRREPSGLSGKLSVAELTLSGNGFDVHSDGPIRAGYVDRVLSVDAATLVVNDGRVTIAGSLPLDVGAKNGDMRVTAALDLRSGYRLVPFLERSKATGMLGVDVQVSGSLRQPAPEGTVNLQGASLNYPALRSPVEQIEASVRFANRQIVLEQASAAWAGAAITAHGAVPLAVVAPSLAGSQAPADAAAEMTLDIAGIRLADVMGHSGDTDAGGIVSLHLDARAPRPEIGAVTANLRFDELNAVLGGIRIDQQGKSAVSLEQGTIKIEQFQLSGPETMIAATGTAQLTGAKAMNLRLTANTNAGLATVFFDGAQITGATSVELQADGTMANPNVHGFASLQDGQFAIETPSVAATNLNFRVDFAGNRFDVSQASGNLNGGSLKIGGGGSWASGGLRDTNLTVTGNDVYMNFPEGLLTVSDLDLNLQTRDELLILGGKATVRDGTFRRNINVQAGVINLLQSGNSRVEVSSQRSEFLSRIRYNVDLETPSAPIVIDNNLGKFGVLADVRLVGQYYEPSITGRVQLDGAGELYLNGNTFYIERGVATFVSEQQIRPEVDVLAHATVAGYDITMAVTGPAGKITTTLTSDPPLSENDIVSVLLVGRPLKDIHGAEAEVASQQLLSYVAGGLGSALSSQLQEVFGLSQVRIEPVLVAGETTPDARLTIGQNLTSNLTLTYSRSIIDGGDDIWIGEYDAFRSLVTRITKQSDNSYRFDLNNDWQFGGTPLLKRGEAHKQKTISAINFTGMPPLSEKELSDKLKVRAGEEFDFFKLRKGASRIQTTLQDRGNLEAQVRLRTADEESQTQVDVDVQAGPLVTFAYEGWQPHGDLEGRIRDIWKQGVFDLQRANQADDALREQLVHDDFLQAKVTHRIEERSPTEEVVTFTVVAGPRIDNAGLIFPGAENIMPKELSKVLEDAGLRDRVLIEPAKVRSLLERYYADRGYLAVVVDRPRVQINGASGSIALPINEGPLFHFRTVVAEGNQAYSEAQIAAAADIADGTTYAPATLDATVSNVQKLYTDHGYNDATVNYQLQRNDADAAVQIVIHVDEGKQHVIRQIVVAGNQETSENLVLGQVRMQSGAVLTTPAVSRARSNLYGTGAYQLIELNHNVVNDPFAAANVAPNQVPVDMQVVVHEIQPYRILAGGYYDTDRGPGALIDISNRNSLGSAKILGLRARYDADLQEGRLYFSQPFLRRFPVRSIGETYITREVKDAFISDRLGLSFGQEARLGNRYILNYGYRIERVQVFNRTDLPLTTTQDPDSGGTTDRTDILADTGPIPPFGSLTRRLAPLTVTISRDTRDDVLDATRGQFLSHGFAIGFGFMGSQQQYSKYYAQYFRYIPLSKPEPVPFKPNLKRARFGYAGGVRFGVGTGFSGQDLPLSERFFAGGGTTIRGFKQDEVGPVNFDGVPLGGDAMIILNNEFRFPLWKFFGAAAFLDVGNVYPRVQDFNPLRLRSAGGVGLRLRTPWVLVRADYGVKLIRHPGESSGAFFISIGQAF